jgi:hypothetical protein
MPTTTETQDFSTIDALSLLTGVMLNDDGGRGMRDLMSYLINSSWTDWWGLPNARENVSRQCKRALLEQHQLLAQYQEFPAGADVDAWSDLAIMEVGPTLRLHSL